MEERPNTSQFQQELQQLIRTFSKGVSSRRDMMRLSAIAAGAVATAGLLDACGASTSSATATTGSSSTALSSAASTAASSAVAASTTSRATVSAAASTTATTVPAGTATASIAQAPAETNYMKGVTVTIPWLPNGQGVTLDPAAAPNWGPFWGILPFIYSGLVAYDENALVHPDLAERWDVTNGGLTYTFHIRKDAKFASGRDVVADDFVYSWKRALNPKATTPMLNFMEHLEGYLEYSQGKATEISGVKVIDPKTLALTLSKPYNFFLSYLAAFVWFVVDKDAVDKYGKDFVANPSGTGPWIVTKFDPESVIEMAPNPNFYLGANPSIAKINPSGSIRSLAMDFKQPPFDDVRVRRAFGHAIDRKTFGDIIEQGTWSAADFYTPPVVLKSDPAYKPPADQTPAFDPAKGKQLLADAGFPNGQGLPEIRYYESSEDAPDQINRWAAFLDMFKQHLGVTVIHDTSMTFDQIQKVKQQKGGLQITVQWWGNITETPQLMSEVFRSDSQYNTGTFNWAPDLPAKGGYTPGADVQQFDKLMTQADVEQDLAKANALYQQGEALMLKNAVFVPFANLVPMQLLKPWIKGVHIGWWNFSQPYRFEPSVVVIKH